MIINQGHACILHYIDEDYVKIPAAVVRVHAPRSDIMLYHFVGELGDQEACLG